MVYLRPQSGEHIHIYCSIYCILQGLRTNSTAVAKVTKTLQQNKILGLRPAGAVLGALRAKGVGFFRLVPGQVALSQQLQQHIINDKTYIYIVFAKGKWIYDIYTLITYVGMETHITSSHNKCNTLWCRQTIRSICKMRDVQSWRLFQKNIASRMEAIALRGQKTRICRLTT